ncbi:helix-turn-helix domain-containing protein [Streptomyces sp. NBC_01294]|uniref:helix-turn-helix domain-containing protein n=1 Tax=Streptomyces sp. NBC_01294 TaxID=2903815 RepID=UPI002DD99C4C|nr:helix-turn-helix transcriptional regulator [Streptomyces sp. NBC_01294]WRZ57085.1 helix-turn-helix transcriptional regulator [Streptomyces sp. NBC_01294]
MAIIVDLDVQLAKRKLSVAEFAAAVGISPANVAVLKNGRAKAVRFTTLDAICRTLDCQPGDVLRWVPDDADAGEAVAHRSSDRLAGRAGQGDGGGNAQIVT